ncbi:MAG: hypothetical protein OEY49_13195 [Candidatus Heimdallarchaeota archaeon]|nr:hypothetical protein [Candidatus Heimdallarchaeota archaeon]
MIYGEYDVIKIFEIWDGKIQVSGFGILNKEDHELLSHVTNDFGW